ncbi:MAG: transposase, partial [Paludibacteraceae bacterium]|nr:transposase [Paludibacteraceae bacterium]
MESQEKVYVRRTQKDYNMSFKLSVVREVETTNISLGAVTHKYGIQGNQTVRRWLEKYGTFDWT